MPVSRTYLCDDCAYEWRVLHWDRDDPVPECPYCESLTARNIPGSFNITGIKAKAVDIAYDMAEQQFGFTDMNDNSREGDIAAKAPSMPQTAEAEALTREMMAAVPEMSPEQAEGLKGFWQTGATPPASPQEAQGEAIKQQYIELAKQSAPETRGAGLDPIGLLHKAGKEGHLGPSYDVVGRAKLSDVT